MEVASLQRPEYLWVTGRDGSTGVRAQSRRAISVRRGRRFLNTENQHTTEDIKYHTTTCWCARLPNISL